MFYINVSKCLIFWHQIRKCLRHRLPFAHARVSFAYAHILSYDVLRGAYTSLRSPQFELLTPHPYKGPLLKHEHKSLERGSYMLIQYNALIAQPITVQNALEQSP